MSNFAKNVLTIGLSHEKQIRRTLMFIILGLSALSMAMWQVNAQGYKEWLYIPFFLGLLLLLGKGTKPEVWSATVLLGGVWNAAQLENMLRGAGDGIVWWFTKGLPGVIVFWLCLTGFLATWSFEQSPNSFFPLVGFSILIFFALTAWDKWEGEWMFNIVLYYSIAVVLIALLKTTFLGEWIDWATDPKAREETRIEEIQEQRQAEIEQAEHEAKVALSVAEASAPTASDQVVDGCSHLAGVQSGLYDFVQGTEGCRHVTLKPNEYYDAVKGPSVSGPRCTRWYPARANVDYLDQPGPDRMVNEGNAVEDFAVYFLKAGETDPVDRSYTCG